MWVSPRCSDLSGCTGSYDLDSRIKVKIPAVKVDCGFIVFTVSVATGHKLNHLNLAIDSLACRICNPMLAVGKKVGKVPFQRLGSLYDRCQS